MAGHPTACPNCAHSFIVQAPLSGVLEGSARTASRQGAGPRLSTTLRPARGASRSLQPASGGAGKFVIWLILAVLAVVGFVLYKSSERPRVKKPAIVQVAPPSATPAPELPPAPVPAPEPIALPAATPPPVNPVAWLREHKESRPREVALLKETEFPVVLNGRVSGSVKVPSGTVVELAELTEESAGVVYAGGGARVPITATDLRQRAEVAMNKANAAAAVAAAAAAHAKETPSKTAATPAPKATFPTSPSLLAMTVSSKQSPETSVLQRRVTLAGVSELHITGEGDPIAGSAFNFTSPDAWLFLENVAPSAAANFLNRMWVNGAPAVRDGNLRLTQHGSGTVIMPHGSDYPAMSVFEGKSCAGASLPLQCYVKYDDAKLAKKAISSFRLKRGYMATIAQHENGTGLSHNYVAQDHDLEVNSLPGELDHNVHVVRIFPWRWVSKKGIGGGIWQNLNVGWFYDWNIGTQSSPEIEYVPIRQNRSWPSLDQDWKARGATHLLGFNEPDRPDQSKLSVAEALSGWPELLKTGLRLGSPATSDGGLGWLYDFMDKANASGLRVDFVCVHYYRAHPNPSDARGAATQFYDYLKGVHDRVKRPLWVTEWNNGANWTSAPKPTAAQQKATIARMIEMLDKTPFVERYALYNWVEEMRELKHKDGSLTPAGEVYRDKDSPLSYVQAKP